MRETIRNFAGKIVGYIDTDSNGNKTVRDFSLRIIGRYDAKLNVTRDFGFRIIARGDATASLLNYD